jgi:hypothetical protein
MFISKPNDGTIYAAARGKDRRMLWWRMPHRDTRVSPVRIEAREVPWRNRPSPAAARAGLRPPPQPIAHPPRRHHHPLQARAARRPPIARIAAGFHYRFSTVVGQDMGRQIGVHTVKTIMQPLEPTSAR